MDNEANFNDGEIRAVLDIKERTIQRLQQDLAKAQMVVYFSF